MKSDAPRWSCDICRVRRAVFYRRFSGHRMCSRCLWEALERGVKRSLRGSNLFRPGVKVLVYASALDPVAGLALSSILSRVEPRYGGVAAIAIPPYIRVQGGSWVKGLEVVEAPMESVRYNPLGRLSGGRLWAPALLRVERGIASLLAQDLGYDVALLPVTRTLISMIGLEALVSARLQYMWDLETAAAGGGAPVALGFRSIESEAVSAFSAIHRLDASSSIEPEYRYKDVYKSLVTDDRPELEFSSASTISLLSRTKSRAGCRCRSCGAPVNCELEYCEDCSKIWL
ncbi:MAG: hypothetical protein F7B20_04300 [Aeropyrum sp.]|nr:hypothetical protein [Aeropyrum sp.]MCE4616347.1 hypothetical protein [Aeropyrum sp.]